MVDYPRLSKGLRRHIRQEKAAIRRQFNDSPEAQEKIKALIEKFFKPTEPVQVQPIIEKPKVEPKPKLSTKAEAPIKKEIKHVKKSQPRSRKTAK